MFFKPRSGILPIGLQVDMSASDQLIIAEDLVLASLGSVNASGVSHRLGVSNTAQILASSNLIDARRNFAEEQKEKKRKNEVDSENAKKAVKMERYRQQIELRS